MNCKRGRVVSAECERICRQAHIRELYVKASISDGQWLTDQMVEPLFGQRAITLIINIESMCSPRRASIDQ